MEGERGGMGWGRFTGLIGGIAGQGDATGDRFDEAGVGADALGVQVAGGGDGVCGAVLLLEWVG